MQILGVPIFCASGKDLTTSLQSTNESLERADQVLFEKLADSVLRFENPDYAALLHMGINPQGKTIKSPVDGFCQVLSSTPLKFIYVQYTTTDKKSLRNKWLGEMAENKGDLIKAAELAAELRAKFPDGLFVVVLVSNRSIDIELSQDVINKAKQLNLGADIWDQTRLRHFLDETPNGHWLRYEYFKIAAERLSEPLFEEICYISLEKYLENIQGNTNFWVERDIDTFLDTALEDPRCSLSLLVSESGQGKSVLCARKFERLLDSDRFCLWVNEDHVQKSNSLDELIIQTIRSLEPSLWPGENETILEIANSKKLVLIVDDINRAPDPYFLLRKLSVWLRQSTSSTTGNQSTLTIRALCPLWPSTIAQIAAESKASSWIQIIQFGLMSEPEAKAAVETVALLAEVPLSPIEIQSIAKELGNDAYLIGLWGNVIKDRPDCPVLDLARNVQNESLNQSLARAEANFNVGSADLQEALIALCKAMFVNRKLKFSRSDAWAWLKERETRLVLSLLFKHAIIIRLDSQESVLFRHDRLRDLLLQNALPLAIQEDLSLVDDPFFARYFGAAIADGQLSDDFPLELKKRNPLALFEAISRFGTPSTPRHEAIVRYATEWINDEVITQRALPNLVWQISAALYRTDSTIVLDLTKRFEKNNYVQAARIRNGSAKSGAFYCGHRMVVGIFHPAVFDTFFDNTLSHAIRHHKAKLIKETHECLLNKNQPEWRRRGAIILAGYLEEPELLRPIFTAWQDMDEKFYGLICALWAVLRCASEKDFKVFEELLKYWNTLSTAEDQHKRSELSGIAEWQRESFRWIHSPVAIHWLIKSIEMQDSRVGELLRRLMVDIDDPASVEFVVRNDAKRIKAGPNDEKEREDAYFSWFSTSFRQWDIQDIGGKSLSSTSNARLREIWRNRDEDLLVRKIAFKLWALSANTNDVHLIEKINSEDTLFDFTLWTRAQLADFSIASWVAKKILKSAHWCWVADSVWNQEISKAVESVLQDQIGKVDNNFSAYASNTLEHIAGLLLRIPLSDAENFLVNYWKYFGKSGEFVICALRLGTVTSRKLAAQSINSCPKEINLFVHFLMRMGRRHGDGDSSASEYTFLKSMEPFLDRLLPSEIRSFGWEADIGKNYEWYEKHIKNRMSPEDRARLFPSDEDLAKQLNAFENKQSPIPRFWLEELERHRVKLDRLWTILEKWFVSAPSAKREEIAFEIIAEAGTRRELPLLKRISEILKTPNINNSVANTDFAVRARTLS